MREDNVRKIWSDAELDAALADLHDDVDPGDDLAFARASLMAAAGEPEAPPQRRRGSWRWIAVAAAVVTLVGGLAVVTQLRSPAPEPAQPAATLQDIDRPLAAGEFHYAQQTSWVPQLVFGFPGRLQQVVELWIPADPAGVWHRRTRWTGGVTGVDQNALPKLRIDRNPVDEYGPAGIFPQRPPMNWLAPDASFVASLTPDRAQLAKDLMRDARVPAEALRMARPVFALGLLRKEVRLALRDTISALPGTFTMASQTSDGRPATVVASKETGERLYFDPSTAQLMAATNGAVEVTTSRHEAPVSMSQAPPSTAEIPAAGGPVSTQFPPPTPQSWNEPDSVYSYAITRTDG
ncbi:hypothetical protein M8542_01705 [Amycolatopsis sp. OK19-0408]|uniref:Uncharacterized protein n=1 Tax=Amycolatopsis iheyensis TaxID=2945988 RepID=A0A9X2SGM3_9PSEU|nr:hypothetical protein [Amycolatopsis iheyensis]MCR6481524.1 hypothetical protein [Amycolatopsis iheyensis]